MLKSVHLVGDDEDDDLYGGFEDYNPALDTGVGAISCHLGQRPVKAKKDSLSDFQLQLCFHGLDPYSIFLLPANANLGRIIRIMEMNI